MRKSELLTILESLGFHPGRKLGQNFLIDPNLLDFIVRSARPEPDELVLEVGPGFGVLTRKLLESGAKVTAVEFDRRICEYLREEITADNFTLVEADACRLDFEKLLEGGDFRCIANLPYSISTIFIARILELSNLPSEMLFMLQKEMGMRLAAKKGTKDYGSLSVRVQAFYEVEFLRKVSPKVFYPAPEVDSALLRFVRKPVLMSLEQRQIFVEIVQMAFGQRRKKMIKQLCRKFDKEKILKAYELLGIEEGARPETVSVDTFVVLSEALSQ